MEKYPNDVALLIEDFRNCGWLEAIHGAGQEDYFSMWQALSSAAKKSVEEGRFSEGKVLWLFADACSMMLRPSSINEPFTPIMVMGGKRSAVPEDFKAEDIKFFAEISAEIANPRLCARIAEIIWLLQKPRDLFFALRAIDNYCQIPLDAENWGKRDGGECWERAVYLCKMLRAGAENRLKEIESTLVESIKNSTKEDGYLTLWLSNLLSKYRLAGNDWVMISKKLEKLATEFGGVEDIYCARAYFSAAAAGYKRLDSLEKFTEMTIREAETWVKEAFFRQASDSAGNMIVARLYENAIQKYRTIPRDTRTMHEVDSRIEELRTEMNSANEKALNEMGVVSTDPIDISELIENARNAVRGKNALDALLALVNIYRGAEVQKIREFSKKMLREHPIQNLFSATHMSKDGRVIAKHPGTDPGGEIDKARVWPEMVKHYIMEIGVVLQGYIWPALEVVRLEHRIKETDFYLIARQSPIVQEGRDRLFAKALFMGYDNDFASALHILVPQIENLVRFHLKQMGVKTTNLDINGIENENGLSTLMEHPEVNTIFGEDIVFEIMALFCDPFGPNLRNELAHGLLDYDESQSVYSIYAWWLGLRIVFNTFWNARQNSLNRVKSSKDEQSENV